MVSPHLSDESLLGFVDGTLSDDERRRWLEHVDGCLPCHDLLAAAAPAVGSTPTADHDEPSRSVVRGAQIGRFTILERIGIGATAEVHAAYDPQLDRRVALKLLRADDTIAGDARLVREGQALARLAHPNVVSVFDAGVHGERRFVAMELVAGDTLRDWLAARPRAWSEIVRLFIDAGRGLAAAHAAGIVHRDVKPENVLVGRDGRPRVADFGLARSGGDVAREHAPAPPLDSAASTLTQTNTVIGTPAYMAPEQLCGDEATPASDQFAFCVALWEGVYGQRPFPADRTRLAAITRGELEGSASDRGPAALRRTLVRGLAADPDARWPSMDDLLQRLEALLPRQRVALIAGALGIALASAAFLVANALRGDGGGPDCALADSDSIDATARDRIARAFTATNRPHAADTLDRVTRAIDERVEAWRARRVAACEATHVRGAQSAALLDLRMACLDRRHRELTALVDVLGHGPDPDVLDSAVDAVAALEPLSVCDDLTTSYPAPPPGKAPGVAAVRAALATARALLALGSYDRAVAATEPLVSTTARLVYPPLTAEVLGVRGRALSEAGKAALAKDTLHDAIRAAATARDDRAMVLGYVDLIPVIGSDRGRYEEALEVARSADIALARAGDPPELQELIDLQRAQIFRDQARYADARAILERVIAARRARGSGDTTDTARALFQLATVLGDLGRAGESPAMFAEALAIFERRLGPQHPNVGALLNNLGMALERAGRFDEARAQLERALELKERMLGRDHPNVATTLNNLAMVADDQGRIDDVLALHRRALAIRERALGPEHPLIASTLSNLAIGMRAQRRFDEALALHRRALAMREKLLGPSHPSVAQTLTGLANVLEDLDRHDAARRAIERAIAIRETALGKDHEDLAPPLDTYGQILLSLHHPEACAQYERAARLVERAHGAAHPDLAGHLGNLAYCHLVRGRPADALPLAERAIAIGGGDPIAVARARFWLAQALWRTNGDRARALELARQARGPLAARPDAKDIAEAVEVWLRERGDR